VKLSFLIFDYEQTLGMSGAFGSHSFWFLKCAKRSFVCSAMPGWTVIAEVSHASYELGIADEKIDEKIRSETTHVDQTRWGLMFCGDGKKSRSDVANIDQTRCLDWEVLSFEPFSSEGLA
jgi:hypothetical protein